jgi:glycosyltransferase involved in cell wall biosynthesis
LKKIRVLHYTTHDEECGIGKYQEQFLNAMKSIESVENTVFEYSPNLTKVMSEEEFAPVFKQFSKQMKDYDILHVQHEFSFFSKNELDRIVSEAKRQGKKVMVTVHTSMDAGFPDYKLRHLKSLRELVGTKRLKDHQTRTHIVPIQKADLVMVHNSVIADSLIRRGVNKNKIIKTVMPVPVVSFSPKTNLITKHLDKKPKDVIFCTVGFLSETKGMKTAVRALTLLPKNYKLAIIGGAHPSGANNQFIEELKELIHELRMESRVYITGYVKEDDKLNALVRECDICVYPYDKKYYAGVTSAALNNALANYKPAIAYPTESIKEMNSIMPVVVLCKSFDYEELAKEISNIDIEEQGETSKKYATKFSYNKEAINLVGIYKDLL